MIEPLDDQPMHAMVCRFATHPRLGWLPYLQGNFEPLVRERKAPSAPGRAQAANAVRFGPEIDGHCPAVKAVPSTFSFKPKLDQSANGFGTCQVIRLCPCLNTCHESYGDAKREKRGLPSRWSSWLTFRSNLY